MKRILIVLILLSAILLTSCHQGADISDDVTGETTVQTTWPSSGVKTDYSGLTPYEPLQEVFTRLSEEEMSELIPSDDYGILLPYAGSILYSEFGSAVSSKYGLITSNGMMVTDAIYSSAYQIGIYDNTNDTILYQSAYLLSVSPEEIDLDDPDSQSSLYAACGLDGSWITSFDYTIASYNEDIIVMVRDIETSDIDVFDYNGKLLYNMKDLAYIDQLATWALSMLYESGEGYTTLQLSDGRMAFLENLTGDIILTEYEMAFSFTDGLAVIEKDGLWGYINTDFETVIDPKYMGANPFVNGNAIVQLTNGNYCLIDQEGNTLYTSSEGPIYGLDSNFYCVYDTNGDPLLYLDGDLNVTDAVIDGYQVSYVSDGWFYYRTENAVVVFSDAKKYELNISESISFVSGEVACVNDTSVGWQEGLIRLDGEVLFPISQNTSFSYIRIEEKNETYYIANRYEDANTYFSVIDGKGTVLFSGTGYINYNNQANLFEITNEQSCGYMNAAGEYVFRISLLEYLPD